MSGSEAGITAGMELEPSILGRVPVLVLSVSLDV
jgi:hypothetical protein